MGQTNLNLLEVEFTNKEDSIQVIPLASDTNSSCFLIQVTKSVKPHFHAQHTETIYVISGTAFMSIGDSTFTIKGGDFIQIPANTVHGVKVPTEKKIKVLSIQAPKFIGIDRHFIEE